MTGPSNLPSELLALRQAVEACERDAEALVSDMTEPEVNWQEHPGRSWSVAQCIDHLATINPWYLSGFVPLMEQARQKGVGPFDGLRSNAFGRWFVGSMEPPVRRKLKARANVAPRATLPLDSLLESFRRSHDSYRKLIDLAANVDVNRVTGPNPFFRMVPMRISTVLRIIPAHDRRHLWQAANVKRALRAA